MALKMQEQYGEDLTVLFVEAQGHEDTEVEKFILGKKWLNDRSIWTTERPFNVEGSGIPKAALLGIEGEILWTGHPVSAHSEVDKLVASEIRRAKKGPKGLGPIAAKSWADFEKGSYAGAIRALEEIPDDSAESEAARKLSASFTARAEAKVRRLAWLIENAEFEQADKLAPRLVEALAGHPVLEPEAKDLADRLASQELALERAAAKALEKIEKRIAKDGLDDAVLRQLQGVVDKHPETGAARRASRMVSLLQQG